MVPLTFGRDVGVETLTLHRPHRRSTEVARVQDRRNLRPGARLIGGGRDPGRVKLRARRLRPR